MIRPRWSSIALVLLALLGIVAMQRQWTATERLGRTLGGDDFWEALERAKPLIKSRADAALRELDYDPSALTGLVSPTSPDPELDFGGDETWLVQYWSQPPRDRIQRTQMPGDFRVYLNAIGEIRRVERGYGNNRELLVGRDLRVDRGMTYAEVQERLGEPDQRRPLSSNESHLGDEVWIYSADASRRVTLSIYFDNHRVTTTGGKGVLGDFPLNKSLLEGLGSS